VLPDSLRRDAWNYKFLRCGFLSPRSGA